MIIVGQGMSFWRGAGGLPWGAEGPCAAGSRHIVTPVCSRIFFFSSSTKLYGCRPEGRRCGCSLSGATRNWSYSIGSDFRDGI